MPLSVALRRALQRLERVDLSFVKTPSAARIIRNVVADRLRRGFAGGFVVAALAALDRNRAHPRLDIRPDEIDVEQPVVEPGAAHLDPLGEHERALELARRDAAMEIDALAVIGLLAADDELVVLDRDRQIGHREAGDRERDAQLVFAELLDVVGWIPVTGDLVDPVERPLEMLEAQQQRRVEQRQSRHRPSPRTERDTAAGPILRHPAAEAYLSVIKVGGKPAESSNLGLNAKGKAPIAACLFHPTLLSPSSKKPHMHPLMVSPGTGTGFTMSIRSPLQHLARWRIPLSLCFCLALALSPSLADARAGSSYSGGGKSSFSSQGSRGTRTNENNNAAPVTRSMTPSNPSATSPMGAPAPAYAGGGSFFQRHPFMTGLAGGVLGSMLFSHMGGLRTGLGFLLTLDRKSTRLNSSHAHISYDVFCL